jgi:cation diffusion facilitator CzcD-associated flavoprotein CzcO
MPLIPTSAPILNNDQIPDYPQCTPHRLKIIHVGMGASGLVFAHKADKYLKNFDLVCYERNSTIGGTWYENRYPGCACDIPAHTYTFPFYGNTEWSGYYSYSSEIQDYFLRFAKHFGVERYAVLNTEVLACRWDGDQWIVDLRKKDGSVFTDNCDVLVNGSGIFNKWKWPSIEGLAEFSGLIAHSANWPQDLDWTNKTVAVIGTGSSSIQMVPRFATSAKHVTVFMRNRTYIGPQIGSSISNKDADPDAMEPLAAGKHYYTEKEKARFRQDPEYHLKYRRDVERAVVSGFRIFYRDSEANLEAKALMQKSMADQIGPGHEDLKKLLIPDWSPGCRRLTPGEGYLEALVRSNVSPTFEEIIKVTPAGILTKDGIEHKVDIIACATGFDVQYLPHFKVVGINGQTMQDREPNIYASIASPGFPNYFVVNGPRGNWGQGCALPSHEVQAEYIIQVCRKIQEDGIKTIMPKEDATLQMNLYMDAWHQKNSVWAEECRSWYKVSSPQADGDYEQ